MILVRFLLRLILVPFGWSVAAFVMLVTIIISNWSGLAAVAAAPPDQQQNYFMLLFFFFPILLIVLAYAAMWMMVPSAIGIVISEGLAIRSWIYHAANGGLSAWIAWSMIGDVRAEYQFLTDPKVIVAAGLAAGLSYWLIAGWSAGFWKPVFAPAPLPPPASPPAPPPAAPVQTRAPV